MDDTVSVAVVGAGGWGKNLIRNFSSLPTSHLHTICDSQSDRVAWAAGHYKGVKVCATLDEVLADKSVQAVVIATPAPTHFTIAKRVLESGKDAFVEKPLSLSAKEALALCELAKRESRILMVGHLMLYNPVVQRLKHLILSGDLGRVHYVVSQRLNLGVVRRDENAWWSLAPHDIAIMNFLLNAVPSEVSASGGSFVQREKQIEDVVFASLRYPEGKLGHVHVSWLDPHKKRTLTIVGDKKMAVFDDASADQKLIIFDKNVELPATLDYSDAVRVRSGDIYIPSITMKEPLALECQAFLDAVRTRKAPLADGWSALQVVRVLEAGARSLQQQSQSVPVGSADV